MIDLYFAPTPNGHKITLFLEEAGLDYRLIKVDLGKGCLLYTSPSPRD